jgi:hypothetical protein
MGLLAVLGFLLGFWSCDTNESKGDLLLDVDGDTTWLSADLVIVILRDPDGKFTDTVFNRKATNLNDFSRLPAMHYTGGKVDIDIRIIKEGKVVSQQVRHFDETALYKPTDTIPQILTIGPKVPKLYIGGESLQLKPVPDWKGGPLTWSSDRNEVATVSPLGEVKPLGEGSAKIRVMASATVGDSLVIQVFKDVPKLEVDSIAAVLVGSKRSFKVVVTQDYGGVASIGWDLDGDGVAEEIPRPGNSPCIFTSRTAKATWSPRRCN